MRKALTPILTALLIAAVALLGSYAMGVFDTDNIIQTSGTEYASGAFTYSGGIKDGLFSGDGTIDLKDGGLFTGSFDQGRFSGGGVYHSQESAETIGWSFDGVFQHGRTESGTFHFSDGSAVVLDRNASITTLTSPNWQYSGGFGQNGQNGTGTFTFEDGSVYKGGFLDGFADGEGLYSDSEGRPIYTGSFKNGSYDGRGTYYSPDGWTYEGSFKNGLFDGEGCLTFGEEAVQGIWYEGDQIRRND